MKYSSLPLVIKSFAKLNLYLRVLGLRKDNFHNLDTLFVRIDLADTIILKGRKDNLTRIKCASRHVPKDETNLCFRAAELLRQEFKISSGLEIEIKKRIPVGAGLGGGSSNAASVLMGLNKYWNSFFFVIFSRSALRLHHKISHAAGQFSYQIIMLSLSLLPHIYSLFDFLDGLDFATRFFEAILNFR